MHERDPSIHATLDPRAWPPILARYRDAAAPDVAKHELGTRPLLCRIAHSDKLLQRWFLAPWTMKHSACFIRS